MLFCGRKEVGCSRGVDVLGGWTDSGALCGSGEGGGWDLGVGRYVLAQWREGFSFMVGWLVCECCLVLTTWGVKIALEEREREREREASA